MDNENRKPVKLCLFCEDFYIGFEQDYSEATPGAGPELWCYHEEVRYHHYGSSELASTDDYRRIILTARECPHFRVIGGEDGKVAKYLRGENVEVTHDTKNDRKD